MKLFKAHKKVARLKGEISAIDKKIKESVSTIQGNEFAHDINALLDDRAENVRQLESLKVRIMRANVQHNMFEKIVEVGEKKALIDLLKELEIKSGKQVEGFRDLVVDFQTQLTDLDRDEMLESLQTSVELLIDELDDFNAVTDLPD